MIDWPPMGDEQEAVRAIVARRETADWYDRHALAVMIGLPRAWQDARPQVDEALRTIGWQDLLTNPDGFVAQTIDPLLADVFAPVAARLLAAARSELQHVVEAQIETGRMSGIGDERDTMLDVLAGLGPIAAGIGVAAILPGAAVVSGTAMLGLVATATVSAPILLGGVAIAGIGLATGALNVRDVRDKRIARIRARIETHVDEAFLSPDHPPSLAARLLAGLSAAAEKANHAC